MGDTVMVHASLRRLGPVEGGAEGVIAALDRAVGSEGTLLMVLGARDDWSWVNERPEAERAALLCDAEPFDAQTTPADPEVGVLAEVFRRHPGTVVSDHPEGRFAARGRLANALIAEPPWDDYFGSGSALERLVEARGRVLRLGADIDTTTLLHYAEHRAQVPDKRRVVRFRKVLAAGRSEIRRVETLDDAEGIVDYDGPDYFGVILREYLVHGRERQAVVGD
jgi:aminoglycoside N3'-acetyltransferase